MNPLKKENFKLVKPGESFDPYQSDKGYAFFSSYEIGRKENFQVAGKYLIRFHYSTKSTELKDYLGNEKDNELKALFDNVPHPELSSNTIEIEIKK
jgi:hypothetical protein